MSDMVHEPINQNLNTLVCKHCSSRWSFVDRKAWSENCPKRMKQTIKALRERNAELQETLLQTQRELGNMRGFRDRALSELARVMEIWVDDNGKVWDVPTAWAYAAACKALERHKSELTEARKAFIGYVEDSHRRRDEPTQPVIGLCVTCHFPVYESEYGGLFHYTYDSTKVCARAAMPENGATEAK